MSDWIDTIARRQAGLEPGFQGADETHEEFAKRLAADEELVLGLSTQTQPAPAAVSATTPSYLPGPQPVTSAETLPPPPAPAPAPGWWLASDGQWYPPEDNIDNAPHPPTPPAPPAAPTVPDVVPVTEPPTLAEVVTNLGNAEPTTS